MQRRERRNSSTPLVGLVAAVVWVVLAFQQAAVQGPLALLGALVGYFFWILYRRVVLEILAAIFRMAEAIAPEGRQPQQKHRRDTRSRVATRAPRVAGSGQDSTDRRRNQATGLSSEQLKITLKGSSPRSPAYPGLQSLTTRPYC
jgi:Domain of unknown function (DUF4282)